MAMNLSKLQEILKDREDWHAAVHGITKSRTWLSNRTIISIKATHSFSEHKLTEPQLNAQIKKWARRDKKAFLSDQCKEIEENNRMGKTRDLFKKN